MIKILQINLNHSASAHDLMIQTLAEWNVGLAIISEPYKSIESTNWKQDHAKMVAIYRNDNAASPPLRPIAQGQGFVMAEWGGAIVIGVYAPPSWPADKFESMLNKIDRHLNTQQNKEHTIIAGDFNAKSKLWGSKTTNTKGKILEEWTTERDMYLMNNAGTSTCLRWQGESVIDLFWATQRIATRTTNCEVIQEKETLSDHRYLLTSLSLPNLTRQNIRTHRNLQTLHLEENGTHPLLKRWATKKINDDLLMAAIHAALWSMDGKEKNETEVTQEATRFQKKLQNICNIAMPKHHWTRKRNTYWWNTEIEDLRRATLKARRMLQRARRRRTTPEQEEKSLMETYLDISNNLRAAIKKAKTNAWSELMQTIDEDPWGRPYRIVLGKIKPRSLPYTISLPANTLKRVLDTLFPRYKRNYNTGKIAQTKTKATNTPAPPITEEEIINATSRAKSRKTTPGPDGIPGKILATATNHMTDHVKRLFNTCLNKGEFPESWKTTGLTLIPKPGKTKWDEASSFRPICLVNEAGKMLEKIIADRILKHLAHEGPNISENQYGFRAGRSTIDAIEKVTEIARKTVAKGGIALAVSLDIANAFNTLPWPAIIKALNRHRIPEYLKKIIEDYLENRKIIYNVGRNQPLGQRTLEMGIPQGSVLGPLLWNLGYDPVLRAATPDGTEVIAYADDTLILTTGRSWTRTVRHMEAAIAAVIQEIKHLGLQISPKKTEALWFHGLPKAKNPPETWITIDTERIRTKENLKYLGLYLDGRLNFNSHFATLTPRIGKTAQYLGRIIPNTYGPGYKTRKLYSNTITSMIMYGAPVWNKYIQKEGVSALRKIQRSTAIRIARAYRTTPTEILFPLAGTLPYEYTAEIYDKIYHRIKKEKEKGTTIQPCDINTWRQTEQAKALDTWRNDISTDKTNRRPIINAMLKHWNKWIAYGPPNLTYRVTQMLTGHGCFANYRKKIGATDNDTCEECQGQTDSATHTLFECPAFHTQRDNLKNKLGSLSYDTIIKALAGNTNESNAVKEFCEATMLRKEERERENEKTDEAKRIRKNRRLQKKRKRNKTLTSNPG